MKYRKSQVTIFILLGIVILIAAVFIYYLQTLKVEEPPYIRITDDLRISLLDSRQLFCVVSNTKDSPNSFNLKFWNGSSTIAAVSKKLYEVKQMCIDHSIQTKGINYKHYIIF